MSRSDWGGSYFCQKPPISDYFGLDGDYTIKGRNGLKSAFIQATEGLKIIVPFRREVERGFF